MSNRRLLPLATLGVSALLLSGCGSASPGVAARVGDETISTARVSTATDHLCTALAPQFEAEGQVVPIGVISQFVVRVLALGAQADQIADDYGITPTASYERAVAEQATTAASFPEETREDYVELMSTQTYAADIVDQVGRAKLESEGFAEPTAEQVTQAGADVFAIWPNENQIEVDPKYGLEVVDGVLSPSDTNVSLAVSDEAKAGLEQQPSAAYIDSLPSNQRCGV